MAAGYIVKAMTFNVVDDVALFYLTDFRELGDKTICLICTNAKNI